MRAWEVLLAQEKELLMVFDLAMETASLRDFDSDDQLLAISLGLAMALTKDLRMEWMSSVIR
jgi:hypothetical protein